MDRADLTSYIANEQWHLTKIKELEESKETINRLTALYESSEGKGSRKVNDAMAERLAELNDEINEYVDELELKKVNVIKMLDKMDNATYRQILSDRYIEGIDLKEIAGKPYIKKEYKYLCNMHGKALKQFDKVCLKYSKNNVKKMEKKG